MDSVRVTGRVREGCGRGVAGVAVSDGVSVTTTDREGHYRLWLDPDRRHTSLVQITVPAGWRAPVDDSQLPVFFRPVPATGGTDMDFMLFADAAATEPDFRFIALTDVHVPVGTDYPTFARVCELVPDAGFMVVSGDLTNRATAQEFCAYRAAAARSGVPVWPAPGNHDLIGQGRGGPSPRRTAKPPYRDAIEGYRRMLGPEWYSFQYGQCHFVVLENYRGLSEADQLTWLERDLAAAGDRPVVVVSHVPWNVPQTPKRAVIADYLELLGRHDVRLLVAGHTHSNEVTLGVVGKARQVVTTAPSSGTLDHTPPGFRVVDLRDNQIEARFVELEPVPPAAAPVVSADAAPPAPGADWPMFHRDARHTGVAAESVAPPLDLAWVHRAGGTILTSSPAVAGDTVYIGVRDEDGVDTNGVLALALPTGERRWWSPAPGAVAASVAVAGELVLAPAARGPLRALSARTGRLRWQWRPKARCWMYFSPTVVDDTVYQAYSTPRGCAVAALDAATGEPRWQTREPVGRNWVSHASPAVAGDALVYATAYANLVALDAATGAQRWQRAMGGGLKVGAAPVLAGGLVLLARSGDRLVAVDLETGEPRWHYDAPGAPFRPVPDTTATPAVCDQVAYAGFTNGTVAAVTLATGALRWRQQLPGAVFSSPVISGPLLYLGCHDGWLRALDRATGEPRWAYQLGAPIASSPVVTGNAVLVATWPGDIYAFTATPAT